MVNLLCICQKLIFGRFFFWQKPKFLAGHYWKHCHTLDLCCVNSVHRMFDHRLCSKCISRIATFVFVSSYCSTISCDYPWSFCWTYLGYLISKTATLILIAPINSNHLYLKPVWNSYTLARPFNKGALNRFEARIQHHKTVIINRCFPAVPICQACHTPPWTAGRWLSRGPQPSLLSLRRVKSKNLESLNVSTISVTRGHE